LRAGAGEDETFRRLRRRIAVFDHRRIFKPGKQRPAIFSVYRVYEAAPYGFAAGKTVFNDARREAGQYPGVRRAVLIRIHDSEIRDAATYVMK